jgi:hypothetical protein
MGTHMKTTVEISDPLLREAKRVARSEGITLRELIEVGLRRALDERAASERKPFKLRDGRNRQARLLPSIRAGDWDQIRALAYGFEGPTSREKR